MTIDPAMAMPGLLVKHRAAAGGPIISVKIKRAPTTGTVMVVEHARTTRNANSVAMRLNASGRGDLWSD